MPGAALRRYTLPVALEGERIISLHEAAEIAGVSTDTLRRRYGHLVIRLSPRRGGHTLTRRTQHRTAATGLGPRRECRGRSPLAKNKGHCRPSRARWRATGGALPARPPDVRHEFRPARRPALGKAEVTGRDRPAGTSRRAGQSKTVEDARARASACGPTGDRGIPRAAPVRQEISRCFKVRRRA